MHATIPVRTSGRAAGMTGDGRSAPQPRWGLFNLGFRPFYLLAALLAAASLPLWVAQYFGAVGPTGAVSGMAWHAHEMVFGFAIAVIAGFLFTAVRNWTGLPTPSGLPLAALAGAWLAGRILLLTGPGPLAVAVDLAFLPLVAAALWKPLHASRNRNRFFVLILLGLAALNAAFHAAQVGWIAVGPTQIVDAALAGVVMIVALMGGRVIPMFTANAVRTARVRRSARLDQAALATLALALAAAVTGAPAVVASPLCLAAAVLHAERLRRWDPLATRRTPILWILHVGYAWIPVGLLLLALALAGIVGSKVLAFHALGIGAMGSMTIGMMTRTARGHTGRPLVASPAEVVTYVLVPLAALVRVAVPLVVPAATSHAVIAAAALWSTAYAIYAVVYWPILSRPRVDGAPG